MTSPQPDPATRSPARHRWGAGRVVALVFGILALLVAAVLLIVGAAVAILGGSGRDAQGFYMTPSQSLQSSGYAIVSESVHLSTPGTYRLPQSVLGRVKITATGSQGGPVFIGVAPSAAVDRYLAGVPHSTVTDLGTGGTPTYRQYAGNRRPPPPVVVNIWIASNQPGQRSLVWTPTGGDWTVVIMNPDGSAPVVANVSVGATLPAADRVAIVCLVAGAVFLLIGLGLVLGALLVRRAPETSPDPREVRAS